MLSVFRGFATNNTWNLYVVDTVNNTSLGSLQDWVVEIDYKYKFKWTGTGANNILATAKNWDDDISPISNAQIELTFAGGNRLNPIMDSDMRFTSIAFDSTAGAFILGGGGQYSLDEGIINNNTVAKQTITNRINIVSAALGIEGVQNSTTELSGVISSNGAAPLYKGGEGLVMLTGSNTYTGNTIIGGGALQLGNGGATGSVNGDIQIYDGSNLVIKRSDNYIYNGGISGAGSLSQLTQDGSGAFTLTRAGSAVGVVNVYNGAMQFAQNGAFNAITSYDTYAGAATRISGSSKLATGAFRQAAGSTLDLTITSSNPIITATTATLSGTLKVSDYWGATSGSASGLAASISTIIRTENGITGRFSEMIPGGFQPGVNYITLQHGVSADTKDYQLRYGLAWYDPDLAVAHGAFNIASGTGFLVDVALNDRAESITSGWDGKSLTKLGDGTLTLSASNNYSGTTIVNGGTLAITGWTGGNAAGYIGQAGMNGTAIVSDTGYWGVLGDLRVGADGDGVLEVTGKVDTDYMGIARESGATGLVRVSGTGRVVVADTIDVGAYGGSGTLAIAGSGTVTSGEIYIHANNHVAIAGQGWLGGGYLYNTGNLTIDGTGNAGIAGNYHQASGAMLAISDHGLVTVGGTYFQNANSTLELTVEDHRGRNDAFITANSATVGGTITVTGFGVGTDFDTAQKVLDHDTQVLIQTTGGISGVFASSTLVGFDHESLPDYLYGGIYKSADSKQYLAGIDLSWFGNAIRGHGNFTIDTGTSFNMDVPLADQNNGPYTTSGWDGKSLTVTASNSGTLILSASNSYTGTTFVNGGVLAVTGWTGSTAQVVIGGSANTSGTLNVSGTGVLISATSILVGDSGSGVLNIAESGTVKGAGLNIGHAANSSGSVTVAGLLDAGASASIVNIGIAGSGVLTVERTGTFLSNNTQTYVGGTANIAGLWRDGSEIWLNDSGAINIASTGTIITDAYFRVNNAGNQMLTVNLDMDRDTAYVIADSYLLLPGIGGGNGSLTVSDYILAGDIADTVKASELGATQKLILHATNGTILGDFADVTIDGSGFDTAGLADYLYGGRFITDDKKDYYVGYFLRWYTGTASASGTFTVDSGTFEIDALPDFSGTAGVGLVDRTASDATGWDGKSLIKLGEGALILSASNTYTGTTTVNGGLLDVTGVVNNTGVLRIGTAAGTSGTVNVSGTWVGNQTSTVDAVKVGADEGDGAGTLVIEQDGYFYNNRTQAIRVNQRGVLTIEDGGWLRNRNHLDVWAGGVLNVLAGGTYTGERLRANGTVNVGGYFSATISSIAIGFESNQSTGVINIAETGTFDGSANATFGDTASNTGIGNIAGLWKTGTDFIVGNSGTGIVAVTGTGRLEAGRDIVIARNSGASGSLAVGGTAVVTAVRLLRNGNNGAGTLSISDSGTVGVGTTYVQNANSTLNLALSGTLGQRGAFITAPTAWVGGTLSVATTSTASGTMASELAANHQVLIHTTGGITGDFSERIITDGASTHDFLVFDAYKNNNDYILASRLAWLSGTLQSHGNFTLDADEVFNVDVALGNATGHAAGANAPAWDGKSLTVTAANSGTLILSASNSYTGGVYIRNGVLAAATGTNAGWALGSGANTVYYDGAAGSDATLLFTSSGTMTQRQVVSPGANATLEAAPGVSLTVTTPPLATNGVAVYVDAGGTFGITGDITFKGNYGTSTSATGAVIYNAGSLEATGAVFASNTTIGYAGAIYNTGTMALASGTIENNRSGLSGGAIYNTGVFTGSALLLSSNTAGPGGGIYAGAVYNKGSVTLLSSTFTGNVSQSNGGAMANTGGGTFTGTDVVFTDNTASAGGAIYNQDGGTLVLNGGTFSGNIASSGGGAIHNESTGGALRGSNLVFVNNRGGQYGGAINNDNGGAALVLVSSTFTGNRTSTTTQRGGAIRTRATITGTSLYFSSNTAYSGGALYSDASTTQADTLVSSTFIDNYASQGGGAIRTSKVLTGTALVFTSNTAGTDGGAINNSDRLLVLESSTFTGNYATKHGGAILAGGTLTGSNLVFTDNYSGTYGGAIRSNSALLIESSTFTGNYAAQFGGAVYASGTFAGAGLFFDSNTAARYGGAILANLSSVIVLNSSTFEGNHAGEYGGVIFNYNSPVSGTNLLFASNTAVADGGAIFDYYYGSTGSIILTSATFSGNYAGSAGGAVASQGIFGGTNLVFTSNTAVVGGGAIYHSGAASVNITTGTFADNYAESSGGAIYNTTGTVTGTNLVFTSNTALTGDGGAIYNVSSGIINITSGTFENNYAGNSGGAIYSDTNAPLALEVSAMSMSGNQAVASGGAIYSGTSFTLELAAGGVFTATNNTAADDASGGFLYANSGGMTFDIGANATAQIGDANSIAATADSISGGASVSLTKTGAGTLALWAYNTYTGTTFVNAGLLSLRGYLASAHTIVAANSTLGGTGTAAGNVTILSHGHLSPGASPGLLTILG
ncbi:autotransporter-associated beta strand repeat-containing protein, partial [Ereboglobus sp. PH5-5]|uniref:beta strand repeat-containing protein n=1 Tax=Ereboglobus sp. PH5-5 TaxID=2940529 RepID=UPI002405E227